MNYKQLGLKGALAGVIIGIVTVIISFISAIFGPICFLNCIIMLFTGPLAAYFSNKNNNSLTMKEASFSGAIGGIVAGLINSIITIIIMLLFGGIVGVLGLSTDDPSTSILFGGLGLGLIVTGILTGIVIMILWALFNAGTAVIYVIIKEKLF